MSSNSSEAVTQRCSVKNAKFVRTPFLIEYFRWLLLFIDGAIPLRNYEFRKKKKCSIVNKKLLLRRFQCCKFFHERVSSVKMELKGNSIELSTVLKYGLTEVKKAPP